ncbi:CoA transferase [Microtetraspora malaysiensis]|uniref:CoA transferase n=1 Tax=Microtetraspora malaysiensis TaxID=161358 RepID=UPI003D8DA9D5
MAAAGSGTDATAAPPLGPGDAPLAGLRVVEATSRVQGPLAGHLLGLLGADVVRLEPPGGDPMRGVPPVAGRYSARFQALNRGKRAVEADLKSPLGRATALRLAAGADVFLHNWPPGRAARLRLDHGDLAAVRPALVHAHAGGWAGLLPHPQPLGTDYLVQAYCGVAALVAGPGEPPAPSLLTITDVLGGLICAEGVVAALLARARAGVGVRVETALVDAARLITDSAAAGQSRAPVRAGVVTDLAAMAADPAYSAAVEVVDGMAYSRAPWTFAPVEDAR